MIVKTRIGNVAMTIRDVISKSNAGYNSNNKKISVNSWSDNATTSNAITMGSGAEMLEPITA
jgi:hypothetical protein